MITQTVNHQGSFRPAAIRVMPTFVAKQDADPIEMLGAQMSFSRNAEIYGEGEAADYLYKVVTGAVRTYKVLADGRRQVGSFHLPGDFFGLEAGDEHTLSAEAIADTRLLVIK